MSAVTLGKVQTGLHVVTAFQLTVCMRNTTLALAASSNQGAEAISRGQVNDLVLHLVKAFLYILQGRLTNIGGLHLRVWFKRIACSEPSLNGSARSVNRQLSGAQIRHKVTDASAPVNGPSSLDPAEGISVSMYKRDPCDTDRTSRRNDKQSSVPCPACSGQSS